MRKIFPILLLGGLVGVVVFWPKICPSVSQMLKVDACNPGNALKNIMDSNTTLEDVIKNPDNFTADKITSTYKPKTIAVTKAPDPATPPAIIHSPKTTTQVASDELIANKGCPPGMTLQHTPGMRTGTCVPTASAKYAYSYLAELSNRRLSYN